MSKTEVFKAKVQADMRIQIPRVVRLRHKLKPGTVLKVEVSKNPLESERFHACMRRDGRFTIPKLYADVLNLKPAMIVDCQIWIPEDMLEQTVFRSTQVSTAPGLFSDRRKKKIPHITLS